jgi:putative spermidine/putrescine transport system substrate-binding protein
MIFGPAPSNSNPLNLLAASLVVAAFAIMGFCPAAVAQTVVFAGWGGSIQQAQRDIYFNSFEKATGIKVVDIAGVSLAKIKAMVESKDVQWDVVQPLGMWIKPGVASGYWEELDYSAIDKSGVPDFLALRHALGNTMYGMILAYNTKAFPPGKEPKSWAHYWDVENFRARRGMLDAPRYTLEIAAIAAGTPRDKLYPLDVEKAFASLDKIKSHVDVWWKQWPQAPQLLASQEIAMTLTSHTRIHDLQQSEHAPVAMQWQDSLLTVDSLAVVAGARNKEAAMKLVNWMTRADLQAEFARRTAIGPANEKALALLDENIKKELPTYHYREGKMAAVDNDWWADNLEKLEERWNAWKLK